MTVGIALVDSRLARLGAPTLQFIYEKSLAVQDNVVYLLQLQKSSDRLEEA
jgi:hypothetical protein